MFSLPSAPFYNSIAKIVEKCLIFLSLLHAIFYYCASNQIGNPEPSFPLG